MSSCSASPFEEGGLRTKNLFLCLTLLIQEKKQLTLNKDFLLAQFFFCFAFPGVPCGVAIPQKVPLHCHESRGKDIEKHRGLYKLGHVKNLPFPMSDINAYLLINLTLSDPFTETWMKLYGYMLKKNLALIHNFRKTNKEEFTKVSDYEQVYHFFLKQQQSEEMVREKSLV